jgi:exoribonuclease II
LHLLPGYLGYSTFEERRRTDNLVRERVSDCLTACESALQARLVYDLQINAITTESVESCRKRAHTLASRARFSPEGASAFMASDVIHEHELQEILNRDLELLEIAKSLTEKIGDLAVQDISTVLNRIESSLNDRNAYLREFK